LRMAGGVGLTESPLVDPQSTIGKFGLRPVWLDFVTRKAEHPPVKFFEKI